MAENPAGGQYGIWQAPGIGLTIEYSFAVLDEIRTRALEGYHALARGGVEIGGLLFGEREGRLIRILATQPFECEHAHGPAFVLSDRDEDSLRAHLAQAPFDPALEGLQPLGWYVSHSRSGLALTEPDLELHNRLFPEWWNVVLVARPGEGAVRAAFFARGRNGVIAREPSGEFELKPFSGPRRSIQPAPPARVQNSEERPVAGAAESSGRSEPPLPARQAEPVQSPALPDKPPAGPPPDSTPAREGAEPPPPPHAPHAVPPSPPRPHPEPFRGFTARIAGPPQMPPPVVSAPRDPLPFGELLGRRDMGDESARTRAWRWLWWIPAGLTLFVAGIVLGAWTMGSQPAGAPARTAAQPAPAAPSLGLTLREQEGQVQVTWDQAAAAQAEKGVLEIEDRSGSAPKKTILKLSGDAVRRGGATYARQGSQVDFRLTIWPAGGQPVSEYASFVGTPPVQAPRSVATDSERDELLKQRDDAREEVSKLRRQNQAQAARISQLEEGMAVLRRRAATEESLRRRR